MNKLVVGNLVHRPLRSLISVFAVAMEVIMILSITAIMLGILNGQRTRQSGIGMDMIVHPGAASNLIGMSGAAASIKVADVLRTLPHVEVVAPVNVQLTAGKALENIYGIDYATYDALRPFIFVAGGPFQHPDDIIIDDYEAARGFKVGDTVDVLHHPFHVCGIVEHGKGGRKFIPIETMNEIGGTPGKASMFYLRTDNPPQFQDAVRKEVLATPGMQQYSIETLDELLASLTPEKLPGFNIGLRIVIGTAVLIGFLVIFQSMYTAVMERTREIGILKSLGASRLYIISVVLRETALLAIVGIALGVGVTFLMRTIFHYKFPTLAFAVTPGWVMAAVLIAFTGAMLGAFYPAIKAARKDPIDALSYE
ncbi:MAG: ABC transporter permease [Acidobacteriales bacterium 59-55]|nr:ABC transporter permease [Terriglobales bacterium]OJV42324.1 MAG: ABC transporter permease [Acidobacteriales bacterium 59-55]